MRRQRKMELPLPLASTSLAPRFSIRALLHAPTTPRTPLPALKPGCGRRATTLWRNTSSPRVVSAPPRCPTGATALGTRCYVATVGSRTKLSPTQQHYEKEEQHGGDATKAPRLTFPTFVEYKERGQRKLGLAVERMLLARRRADKHVWVVMDHMGSQKNVMEESISFVSPSIPLKLARELKAALKNEEPDMLLAAIKEESQCLLAKLLSQEAPRSLWLALLPKFQNEPFSTRQAAAHLFLHGKSREPAPLEIYAVHCMLQQESLYFRPRGRLFACREEHLVTSRQSLSQAESAEEQTSQWEFLCRLRKTLQVQLKLQLPAVSKLPPALQTHWQAMQQKPESSWRLSKQDHMQIQALIDSVKEEEDDSATSYPDAVVALAALGIQVPPDKARAILEAVPSTASSTDISQISAVGLPEQFGPHLEEEAQRLLINPPSELERWDLRDHQVFAVDNSDATEIDDAFSIAEDGTGAEWVFVHIADPSKWIVPHSVIDEEALRRGNTIYLPSQPIPMLPPAMVLQASLRPRNQGEGQNYALTFAAKLCPETGKILRHVISPSILPRDIHALDYDKCDMILSGRSSAYSKLQRLNDIATLRRQGRVAKGAQLVIVPKVQARKAPDGQIQVFKTNSNSFSNTLVEEMMILSGEVAATFARNRQISIPFRAQEPPFKHEEFTEYIQHSEDSEPLRSWKIRSFLRPSTSVPYPQPHFSLGLSAYAQVSSPLRRYSDLLAHYQIKAALAKTTLPFAEWQLVHLIQSLEQKAQEKREIEAAAQRQAMLQYLASLPKGTAFQALVLQCTPVVAGGNHLAPTRATVLLQELNWVTIIDAPRNNVQPGDKLTLGISTLDVGQDHLSLVSITRNQRLR